MQSFTGFGKDIVFGQSRFLWPSRFFSSPHIVFENGLQAPRLRFVRSVVTSTHYSSLGNFVISLLKNFHFSYEILKSFEKIICFQNCFLKCYSLLYYPGGLNKYARLISCSCFTPRCYQKIHRRTQVCTFFEHLKQHF